MISISVFCIIINFNIQRMKKNDFLLHFPDGSVSYLPKKGAQPDAFLFRKTSSIAFWVIIPISEQQVTRSEAFSLARENKIEGKKAHLLDVFDLWSFLSMLDDINELLKVLGMPLLKKAAYWCSNKDDAYAGIHWQNSVFRSFSITDSVKKASAIFVVSVFGHDALQLCIGDEYADRKVTTVQPTVPRTFYKRGKFYVNRDGRDRKKFKFLRR